VSPLPKFPWLDKYAGALRRRRRKDVL
jgi:hypothetical protein